MLSLDSSCTYTGKTIGVGVACSVLKKDWLVLLTWTGSEDNFHGRASVFDETDDSMVLETNHGLVADLHMIVGWKLVSVRWTTHLSAIGG